MPRISPWTPHTGGVVASYEKVDDFRLHVGATATRDELAAPTNDHMLYPETMRTVAIETTPDALREIASALERADDGICVQGNSDVKTATMVLMKRL